MATETHEPITEIQLERVQREPTETPMTLSLSMLAGLGVTLMIVMLAIGAVQGDEASPIVGLLFAAGLVATIGGMGAWLAIVRPFENFDDINQPMYHGHDHAEHDHEEPGEVDSEAELLEAGTAGTREGDSVTGHGA